MSDTPRTSSILALILETSGVLNSKTAPQQLVILCRELERELNAANAIIRQQQLLDEENLSLRQRIKRLEEAGDQFSKWADRNTPATVLNDWTAAKEAKP